MLTTGQRFLPGIPNSRTTASDPENIGSVPLVQERNAAWEIGFSGLVLVVLQADLQLMNGFIRRPERVYTVTAEVMIRFLQMPFGILQRMDCRSNLGMPFTLRGRSWRKCDQ
jgi:hypothetical protein